MAADPWFTAPPVQTAQTEQPEQPPSLAQPGPHLLAASAEVDAPSAEPAPVATTPMAADVPWDRPFDSAEQTDRRADGAPWDRPEPDDWNQSEVFDDRPVDMFDDFNSVVPSPPAPH